MFEHNSVVRRRAARLLVRAFFAVSILVPLSLFRPLVNIWKKTDMFSSAWGGFHANRGPRWLLIALMPLFLAPTQETFADCWYLNTSYWGFRARAPQFFGSAEEGLSWAVDNSFYPICQVLPDVIEIGDPNLPIVIERPFYSCLTTYPGGPLAPSAFLISNYSILNPPLTVGQPCGQSYVVKLTRQDGSTGPGGELAKIEPTDSQSLQSGHNMVTLVARAYDQNGQVVPNVGIQLTADVEANSGGHDHPDDQARHTQYMGTLAPVGTSQGTKVLTGNTGSDGLKFTFTAPAPAGDHTITAICTGGKTCTQSGPSNVWVGVKNLYPIGPGPWQPVGSKDDHKNNNYLTTAAFITLQQLGVHWRQIYVPFGPVFYVNDASLERGGLFDCCASYTDRNGSLHYRSVEGWWHQPHDQHRRGTVVDIDGIRPEDGQEFEDYIARLGGVAEQHHAGTGLHYHVELMGVRE